MFTLRRLEIGIKEHPKRRDIPDKGDMFRLRRGTNPNRRGEPHEHPFGIALSARWHCGNGRLGTSMADCLGSTHMELQDSLMPDIRNSKPMAIRKSAPERQRQSGSPGNEPMYLLLVPRYFFFRYFRLSGSRLGKKYGATDVKRCYSKFDVAVVARVA